MFRNPILCLALFCTPAITAAVQDFRLGLQNSTVFPGLGMDAIGYIQSASDAQGAAYLLLSGTNSQSVYVYELIKVSPSSSSIVYAYPLNFQPVAIAADAEGDVYLAGNDFVQKRGPDGTTIIYTTKIGESVQFGGLTVDSAGRAYVTGWSNGTGFQPTPGAFQQTPAQPSGPDAFVARLKASGTIDYAGYIGGGATSNTRAIAVDTAGSAFILGSTSDPQFPTTPGAYLAPSALPDFPGGTFLMRLSPDGSAMTYSTFTNVQGYAPVDLALDGSDNATVLMNAPTISSLSVLRLNAEGSAAIYLKSMPGTAQNQLIADSSGDAYFTVDANANFPVRNSVVTCPVGDGGQWSVLVATSATGDVLQATYVPDATNLSPAIGFGPGGSILVVGMPANPPAIVPGSPVPPPGPPNLADLFYLATFAQNADASVVGLACVANAATYGGLGITGGELVSLFGQGLGPLAGTQPVLTSNTGFPKQLAGVQVTFNGVPGPLTYVQDSQINAIAPWALEAGQTVTVCAVYNGVSNCMGRPVVTADPGVFTMDGFHAIAMNQDGTLNSPIHPAPVGTIVSVFATGLGAIDPPLPDGAIVQMPLPVDVLPCYIFSYFDTFYIGTVAVPQVLKYAGPAPFEVAGISQVNFVAANTAVGAGFASQSPLYLQVGGPQPAGAIVGSIVSGPFQIYVIQ